MSSDAVEYFRVRAIVESVALVSEFMLSEAMTINGVKGVGKCPTSAEVSKTIAVLLAVVDAPFAELFAKIFSERNGDLKIVHHRDFITQARMRLHGEVRPTTEVLYLQFEAQSFPSFSVAGPDTAQ